ncbi:MAG: acyl-CoA dehydrogenase family protein [Myxococcales bacterium]|nr:acyl-CoA dehydrogenase family protein [Myxococcales bacterium]
MSEESLYELACPKSFLPVIEQVKTFIQDRIVPVQEEFFSAVNEDDIWTLSERQSELLEGLKAEARKQNLWNFFLPDWNDVGVTNLEYAYLASEMGKAPMSSEVFNCSAPDTGNMEVLAKFGSEAQQEKWLKPLLAGEIRSCFGMTEPGLASSDAKNIATSAVLDGDEWVINGEKFYISGAGDSRCKVMICMVQTNPDAARHLRQSQILVPMDAEGLTNLGPMNVFGDPDAPHGHMHLKLENVRVPKDYIILGEGRGFEISQGRLGPGRIHHCMRLLGSAERALEMMIKRGAGREAFGKPLVKLGGNYDVIARSRIEIDAARLMVLRAARAMDTLGTAEARVYISGIKAMVPEMACTVIDRAIQMHGATGVSQWTPLARMYTSARTLRLADGPDEVHRMVVARAEIAKYV